MIRRSPSTMTLACIFCLTAISGLVPTVSAQGVKIKNLPIAAVEQEQVVNYWTIEGGWHSELQLRNNITGSALVVTPVIRAANGEETNLLPVSIQPDEVVAVDIRKAIETAAPGFPGTYGSLALKYHSSSSHNLYAAMMVHDMGHPIAFHIDAVGHMDSFEGATREGVWWLPNDTAKDILILTNQGADLLNLRMSLYDAKGRELKRQMTLGPHETNRLSLRDLVKAGGLTGNHGGLQISAAAHEGALDTLYAVYDEGAGFSASLKMFDRDPKAAVEERDFAETSAWTLRAPMLALSNPDPALNFPPGTVLEPQLFIRNTTGKTVHANLTFNWRENGKSGKSAGPKLILHPYETLRLDVAALQHGGLLPKGAQWASVILATDCQPDEVMAVAASYDKTLRYGAQTPFSDQLTNLWEGGEWQYDSMHDSIITAGNGSRKPMKARFTIFYNQGKSRYDLEQDLKPDEQMWVDVGELIRGHVPNKAGLTLPVDLQAGSYQFADLTNEGIGTLFEGKVIYDKTFGHVAYGCSLCCGYQAPQIINDPLGLGINSGFLNGIQAIEGCTGGYANLSSRFPNWGTNYPNIATTTRNGYHTGMSVGTTPSYTSGTYQHQGARSCPQTQAAPRGTTNVVACPTSIAVDSTIVMPLSPWVPQKWLTGLGIIVGMKVGPASSIWDGTQVTEAVSTVSNTCPKTADWPPTCPGGPALAVGVGGTAIDGETEPDKTNVFWDQHVDKSNVSLLDISNTTTTCSVVCSQQYSCQGKPLGNPFTITYRLAKGNIKGYPVTNVSVTKQ